MQHDFRKEGTPLEPVWVENSLIPIFFGSVLAGLSLTPQGARAGPQTEAAPVIAERIGRVAAELDILLESWDEMRSDARAGTLTYGELESRRADLLAQTAQRVLAP